jgi:type II secretory pathway component PulC
LAFAAEWRHVRGTMRGSRLVLLGLLTGCGAASPPAVAPRAVLRTVPVAARAESPRPPKGALFREDVNALIERGFPEFLQRVEVEPRLVDGQFRGWSIVNLSPSQFWSGVDLKPGDVVLRVNDLPIERETEAFDVFESLKQSDALRVAFQRGGQTRLLEYKIVAKSN